jgi:hypothetical protein
MREPIGYGPITTEDISLWAIGTETTVESNTIIIGTMTMTGIPTTETTITVTVTDMITITTDA